MSGGAGSFMQLHTATISARYFRLQTIFKATRMGGLLIMIMIVIMSLTMLMMIKNDYGSVFNHNNGKINDLKL